MAERRETGSEQRISVKTDKKINFVYTLAWVGKRFITRTFYDNICSSFSSDEHSNSVQFWSGPITLLSLIQEYK